MPIFQLQKFLPMSKSQFQPFSGMQTYGLYLLMGLLFIICIPASVIAQRVWEEDVVYLKNGSIIRGEIIHQEIGKSVNIRLREGIEMTLMTSEIEKISREPAKFSKLKLKFHKRYLPVVYRSQKLYQMISFGLAINETRNTPNATPVLHYRTMYHLNRWLNLGIGTGLDAYEGGLVIPVYGEIHGEPFRRQTSPYYFAKGGYGIGANGSNMHDVFQGGYMAHFGGGIILHNRDQRSEWMFSVGFKMQQTYQEFREWPRFWNWNGNVQIRPEPVLVTGVRRYQNIVWEIAYVF